MDADVIKKDWFQSMAQGNMLYMSKDIDLDAVTTRNNTADYMAAYNDVEHRDAELYKPNDSKPHHYKNSSTLRLPLIGRIHYVYDVQGYMQISAVFLYWIYGSFSTLFCILLPMYADNQADLLLIMFYSGSSIGCIVSLIRACTMNPGRVTENDYLECSEAEREYCKSCMLMRPPRSHHCRRCQHCVIKMDHHCPWINNCVGSENQYMFMLLLFYAVLLSANTFMVDMLYFYFFPECKSCDKQSVFIVHQKGMVVASFIMAVLMMILGGCLLLVQFMNITYDMTTIDWMKLQSNMTTNGFDITKLPKAKRTAKEALLITFGRGNMIYWILPCRKRISHFVYRDHEIV